MNGPCSECFENSISRPILRRAAGDEGQRVEVALNGPFGLDMIAGKAKLHHPIEPDCIDRHGFEIAPQLSSGTARKSDDRRLRNFLSHRRYDSRHRRDAPFLELFSRQHTRPGVENLHGVDAGSELLDQITHRGIDKSIDELREGLRMTISKKPRR